VAITHVPVDPVHFHQVELPRRLAEGGAALAAPGVRGRRPLAIRIVDGPTWTYRPGAAGLEIVDGDADAHTAVALDRDAFARFVQELQTAPGLLYSGALVVERGSYAELDAWEPALRAAWHGRPVYDAALVVDATGDGVRPHTQPTHFLDDGDDALAAFLQRYGFLHVRGVFAADEVAELRAEVDRIGADAVEGDRRSWWATGPAGDRVLCRLTYLSLRSDVVARVAADERVARLHRLLGQEPAVEHDHSDGVSVVCKVGGATDGLADLPWHADCGLGGHPLLCPSLAVGIQLEAGSAATGRMRFLAGSHVTSAPRFAPHEEAGLPIVDLDTEPGDCTVHLGHVLHQAPPPTRLGPGRRTIYVTSSPPDLGAILGAGNGYNDVLFRDDGRVPSVEQLA
jgi:hypothetical protein